MTAGMSLSVTVPFKPAVSSPFTLYGRDTLNLEMIKEEEVVADRFQQDHRPLQRPRPREK